MPARPGEDLHASALDRTQAFMGPRQLVGCHLCSGHHRQAAVPGSFPLFPILLSISFLPVCDKYVTTSCRPDTVLGAGDAAVNKRGEDLAFMNLTFQWKREFEKKKTNRRKE